MKYLSNSFWLVGLTIFSSVYFSNNLALADEGRPKEEWITAMTTALPTAFCKKESFFRECFKVTAEECEETALSAVRVCMKKHQEEIPAKLNGEKGRQWGTTVGGCAGSTYELTLHEKKISNPKCEDPKEWMK